MKAEGGLDPFGRGYIFTAPWWPAQREVGRERERRKRQRKTGVPRLVRKVISDCLATHLEVTDHLIIRLAGSLPTEQRNGLQLTSDIHLSLQLAVIDLIVTKYEDSQAGAIKEGSYLDFQLKL